MSTAKRPGRVVKLAGKDYRFTDMTSDDLAELQAWLDARLEDPLAVIEKMAAMGLPPEAIKDVAMAAYQDKMAGEGKIGSKSASARVLTPDGVAQVLYLRGRTYQPEMTAADWEPIGLKEVGSAIAKLVQENSGGAVPDPKAASSATDPADQTPTTATSPPATGTDSASSSPSAGSGLPTPFDD